MVFAMLSIGFDGSRISVRLSPHLPAVFPEWVVVHMQRDPRCAETFSLPVRFGWSVPELVNTYGGR
jgi:hypothetical protein